MITYKKQTITKDIPDVKVCDKCKKEANSLDWEEFQEFFHIDFKGGYTSVFGDLSRVKCDLCQSCLKEMIDGFCRIEKYEDYG